MSGIGACQVCYDGVKLSVHDACLQRDILTIESDAGDSGKVEVIMLALLCGQSYLSS